MNNFTIEIKWGFYEPNNQEMIEKAKEVIKKQNNIEPKIVNIVSIEYSYKHSTIKYKFEYE